MPEKKSEICPRIPGISATLFKGQVDAELVNIELFNDALKPFASELVGTWRRLDLRVLWPLC